jgi:thymidylate synthase (FAD)
MKIVEQSFEILSPLVDCGTPDEGLLMGFKREARLIERAGRTAYKSERKITQSGYDAFIRKLIKRGHDAVIEFGSMAVSFTTSRGISHELVRHRECSFVQESTRYCSYDLDRFGGEITVIRPSTWASRTESQRDWLERSLQYAELNYLLLVQDDVEPQYARDLLPNALKTEIVVKANFRQWRHMFRLRAIGKAAHPDMRALMIPLYKKCCSLLPCCFEDLGEPE